MTENLAEILLLHKQKYPLMEIQDAVKLIYQNEFGPGHLINDESECFCRLDNEAKEIEACPKEADYIGNDLCRLYLSDAKEKNLSLESVFKMFLFTANSHAGNMESFIHKLEILEQSVQERLLKFDEKETLQFLKEYESCGMPAVHHSKGFGKAYKPSYRVIDSKFLKLIDIVKAVNSLKENVNQIVVAIDGRCGSGKSTYANLLSFLFDSPVVHVDDFFLPPYLRTKERLQQTGGNVDYERFSKEVLSRIKNKKEIRYKPFDCSAMDYGEEIKIPCSPVIIIEGSYALHPFFGDYADVKVFSDVNKDIQRERILKRNGEKWAENFFEKWIPMEERYFCEFKIKDKAEFTIS